MRKRWLGRIIAALAVWLAVVLMALVFGATIRPVLLAILVGALACAMWLLLDGSAFAQPSYWRQVADSPVRIPGQDRRVDALVRHLDKNFAAKDSGGLVYADLVAVADQRLMTRHGFNRLHDPARAAAVLGPELARFVAQSTDPRRQLSIREIENVLNRIEAL